MKFKPTLMYSTLENGEYTGTVTKIHSSSDMRNFWLSIKVEGKDNGVFNTMFTAIDSVFNNFACQFVDDEGYFDSEKAIGKEIVFIVETRNYNDTAVSKITQITVQ